MNLPNYFLADLPSEATLSAAMITEACQTLKRNREQYLAGRPTQRLVRLLSEIGENWLQPDYPFRKLALDVSESVGRQAAGVDVLLGDALQWARYLLVRRVRHPPQQRDGIATDAALRDRIAALDDRPRCVGPPISQDGGAGAYVR
jgi:hypothetical protein